MLDDDTHLAFLPSERDSMIPAPRCGARNPPFHVRAVALVLLGELLAERRPRPCNAKRANESSKIGSPAAIRMPPITRAIGNSAGSKCHCVKYHGPYTASVPGAITKKIADPMIAGARRMTSV